MIVGDQLWDAAVTTGLRDVEAGGRVVRVFDDAPPSLYASLAATAARQPGDVALTEEDGRRCTFAELLAAVERFAGVLSERVRPGERVAFLLDTSIEFAVALYAANRLGAVVVPVPTKYREPEVESLLERAGAVLVIADRRFESLECLTGGAVPVLWADRDHVDELWSKDPARPAPVPSQDPDADAVLMYTSGTTARSKGVLLTNRNAGHAIVAYERTLGLGAGDSTILPVPIYHITGLVAVLGLFVHIGGRVHLQRRFDAVRVLETARDEAVTFLHASPTVFTMLLQLADRFPDLPHLRSMACGAAHMPVSRLEELHAWLPGMAFHTVYGLTETSSPALVFPGDSATSPHRGSSGIPIPGLVVAIRRPDGSEAEVGERGEIWLRGTNVLRRYDGLDTPALTADGWLSTGDVGYADAAGYVYVVDRTKDMINRGGEKVWCIDVEEELRRLPGVRDAAVVGVPHSVYGEEPAALLAVDAGAAVDPGTIPAALRARLATYQIPRHYRFCEELPLTPNLKVDKKAVRRLFEGALEHA
ncbi:fatty-acyl-CoA synthase/long-chain acyl-CoA synthetase [Georgenia soli]|uniref:Fatty-acyl-CoA synthase/long-chain acyl-CoA synthetase n=1 Tax=Georgenia soli TaxID=638953 RepID=A0A2A9EJG6_9MICO|nr:class I adenylate-forming enzyme family protein [Georgenia soli]PFG39048.1 fatty-acyl-CoA synthase/long-chain acyl-CoA synthetase [Georgenia soli]